MFPSVYLASLNGVLRSFISVGGGLQVSPPGTALLTDPFDGSVLDTVNRWSAPVVAGAGAITVSNGMLQAAVGTGASSAAAVSSIESFVAQGQGFLTYGSVMQMEPKPGINTHRFAGQGTPPGSFTAATPLQDGIGWEFDTTGSLNACVYQGGSRVKAIPYQFPLDGSPFVVATSARPDAAYFFYQSPEEPVITIPLPNPNFATLPFRFHVINGTAGPAVAPTWNSNVIVVIDTSGNYPLVYNGQALQRARSPGKFVSISSVSIATAAPVWTPASGRKFRLMGYQLTSTGTQNIVLTDGATPILTIPGVTAGQLNFSPPMGNGILSAAVNNVLSANAGGAASLSGYFFGTEE